MKAIYDALEIVVITSHYGCWAINQSIKFFYSINQAELKHTACRKATWLLLNWLSQISLPTALHNNRLCSVILLSLLWI